MRAIAEAEEDRKAKPADDDSDAEITASDLADADRQRLIDDAHLDLFVTWYQFGGQERGLSPMEIAAMPADLLSDFQTLLAMLGRERRRAKAKHKRPGRQGRQGRQR